MILACTCEFILVYIVKQVTGVVYDSTYTDVMLPCRYDLMNM